MSNFEIPKARWDGHVQAESGVHIGITRPGFDGAALDEAYRGLIDTGHTVMDGAVEHTKGGGFGELVVEGLTDRGQERLRSLGFVGLEGLDIS